MLLEAGLVGMGPLAATPGDLRPFCVWSSKFSLWPFCEKLL